MVIIRFVINWLRFMMVNLFVHRLRLVMVDIMMCSFMVMVHWLWFMMMRFMVMDNWFRLLVYWFVIGWLWCVGVRHYSMISN